MMLVLALAALLLQGTSAGSSPPQIVRGASPIPEPYASVGGGGFSGPQVPESPDPLVAYRWPNPKAADDLQIFLLKPKTAVADRPASFENLESLLGNAPNATVKGTGSIRMDFGVEAAAWVEFDSPDCPGGVRMSISEYNEPGVRKTRAPVRHGGTYRLELNRELYDGVRFAWIHADAADRPWHITGIRAVCQIKPANYNGRFSCDDPLLTRTWYASAYSVRVALCKDYFGAVLMERGDRMSWTGDAHPSQAAALVAFKNTDFIKKNIDATSTQNNGIRSYSLYWVLSLIDYYMYTGDAATLAAYASNACAKLDEAYDVFPKNPKLRFYGWDERLCAGFELWFKPAPEAQRAYQALSIRVWADFAAAMGRMGRADLAAKYDGWAREKMAELRRDPSWFAAAGLHAAADAVTTGLLDRTEEEAFFEREFRHRVNRVSFSPFNQYFIIQALARMGKHDDALSTVRDLWGGMVKYGGTTTFETYRPSWNDVLGPNDAVPNTQSGITSLCHPWGAGLVKWLNEEVLGIKPASPGFAAYEIRPHLGRTLTRVSGTTPTPLGDIRASFDTAAGRCAVEAPASTLGRIGIPKAENTISRIRVNGSLAWDGVFHAVPGIGGAVEEEEFVTFTGVRPGAYDLSVAYAGSTPPYREPPVAYAARFVKQDAATGGSWGGVYGTEGYVLCNYAGGGVDRTSLPGYVKSLEYFRAFPKCCAPDPIRWAASTADRRALAPDSSNALPRAAACVSSTDQTLTVAFAVDGPRPYQVALYFVDWEDAGARLAVEMFDADSLKLVAPVKIVNGFAGGRYVVYAYDRSAKFRIDKVRGRLVSLSGIFFDPAPEADPKSPRRNP